MRHPDWHERTNQRIRGRERLGSVDGSVEPACAGQCRLLMWWTISALDGNWPGSPRIRRRQRTRSLNGRWIPMGFASGALVTSVPLNQTATQSKTSTPTLLLSEGHDASGVRSGHLWVPQDGYPSGLCPFVAQQNYGATKNVISEGTGKK